MDHLVEGAAQFREQLEAGPMGFALRIARALKVSDTTITNWKNGLRRPESLYRDALELMLGIKPRSWNTAEENAQIDAAVEAFRAAGEAA